MKTHTLNEVQDKIIGEIGTPNREQFEYELQMDLIGQAIKQTRQERKLTQEELGKKTDLKRTTIVKIENSQRAISLDEAVKIAAVFSLDVDTMYSYIQNKEDKSNEESCG